MKLGNFYASKNVRLFMLIPAVLFIVFLLLIFVWPTVPFGIDLKGGTMLLVRSSSEINSTELQELLAGNFDLADLKVYGVSSPAGFGVNVQFSENRLLQGARAEIDAGNALAKPDAAAALQRYTSAIQLISPYLEEKALSTDITEAQAQIEQYFLDAGKNISEKMQSMITQRFNLGNDVAFQRKEVSPTLSGTFWQTAINVALFAGISIIIVVFFFFRKVVPSLAIIFAALFDVLGGLAGMAVFGIPLSLSSIPALLMLIGYSIDTDVMLTTRMFSRKDKEPKERASESMVTGLTMTGTTLAALSVMAVVSFLNQIEVIFAISAILLFGLIADLVSTWLMNAAILLWYVERENKKKMF